jgi:hypothetical protein
MLPVRLDDTTKLIRQTPLRPAFPVRQVPQDATTHTGQPPETNAPNNLSCFENYAARNKSIVELIFGIC